MNQEEERTNTGNWMNIGQERQQGTTARKSENNTTIRTD